VTPINPHLLLGVGLLGQALFSGRFLVQWFASEHAGRSIVPEAFWHLSVAGGLVLFLYAFFRHDPVFVLGQGAGLFIYARNLHLLHRSRRVATTNAASAASLRAAWFAPRFWPTWIGIGLGRAIARLPVAWQLRLGRGAGRLAYRTLARHRHVARRNLQLCFPDRSAAEHERLLQQHFQSLGMALAETSLAWGRDIERLRGHVTIQGLGHVQAASAQGKGVILLSGHNTCMELTGILLALLGLPVHTHYRNNRKNPLADHFARAARGRYAAGQIDRRDVRRLVQVLREGGMVLYAPDHLVRPSKRSLLLPFFGEPALVHAGLRDIARLSGAQVVPYLPRRIDDRGRYELRFLPALQDFPGDDAAADLARVIALLEQWVCQDPAQYLWIRPRFAKRPPPLPDPYRRVAPAAALPAQPVLAAVDDGAPEFADTNR